MRPQYLWRKQAGDAWLRANEAELLDCFATRVAFIQRPGQTRTIVEILTTRLEGAQLIRKFGGKIARPSPTISFPRSKPLKIGLRLVVTDGQSRARMDGRRCLIIPASGAFGTGEHATTAMCLRLIEQISRSRRKDWTMLDVGTGTGILALAARCFGATTALAIDNDARAIAIAKSNARLNHIRGIRFEISDAMKPAMRGKVDLLAANLFSELLIAAIPKWQPQLKTNGVMVLSGILRNQERAVARALRKQKIAIEKIHRRGKWVAILAQKAG